MILEAPGHAQVGHVSLSSPVIWTLCNPYVIPSQGGLPLAHVLYLADVSPLLGLRSGIPPSHGMGFRELDASYNQEDVHHAARLEQAEAAVKLLNAAALLS